MVVVPPIVHWLGKMTISRLDEAISPSSFVAGEIVMDSTRGRCSSSSSRVMWAMILREPFPSHRS
jgi:hypothetical protein